jgi:hypothetical protein
MNKQKLIPGKKSLFLPKLFTKANNNFCKNYSWRLDAIVKHIHLTACGACRNYLSKVIIINVKNYSWSKDDPISTSRRTPNNTNYLAKIITIISTIIDHFKLF